jgi:heat induced stress protein YflT
MAETVVGVFDTHRQAIHGVEELRGEGFRPEQISIFAPDPREVEGYAEELGVSVLQAGATGLAAGGLLGGIAGWVVGLTGLLVPGAGLVLAAGPLAGAIVGAIGGASVGGFVGLLVGLGLPRHAAEEYAREIESGRTLIFIHPEEGRSALAEAALARAHPLGIHHYQEPIG